MTMAHMLLGVLLAVRATMAQLPQRPTLTSTSVPLCSAAVCPPEHEQVAGLLRFAVRTEWNKVKKIAVQ